MAHLVATRMQARGADVETVVILDSYPSLPELDAVADPADSAGPEALGVVADVIGDGAELGRAGSSTPRPPVRRAWIVRPSKPSPGCSRTTSDSNATSRRECSKGR